MTHPDKDLERVAREAEDARRDNGHCGEGTMESHARRARIIRASQAFVIAFTPEVALALLSRTQAAEARAEAHHQVALKIAEVNATLTAQVEGMRGALERFGRLASSMDTLNDQQIITLSVNRDVFYEGISVKRFRDAQSLALPRGEG